MEEPRAADGRSDRVTCPACATQQHVPADPAARCVICGTSLAGADVPAVQPNRPLVSAAKELSRQGPRSGPAPEMAEVLSAHRRLGSILAFVPLWGLRRLARSEEHTRAEKLVLGFASLLTTVAIGFCAWTYVPSASERTADTHERVHRQIETLHRLAEEYRREHGQPPDDSAWNRSAASGDLRFYDPWGRPYRYEKRGEGYAIGTYGADGAAGGSGDDADVVREFAAPSAPGAAPG